MRILLMIQRLWQGGGTETHVLSLAKGLRKQGHQVEIYTGGGPWVAKARKEGISTHVHPGFARRSSKSVQHFASLIQQRGIGIVHAHDAVSLSLASDGIRRLSRRPKLVFSIHGPYVNTRPIRVARHMLHAVIIVSPPLRSKVIAGGIPSRKVHVIQNGIPIEIFRPITNPHLRRKLKVSRSLFVIGYAGRFTFDKIRLSRRIAYLLRRYSHTHQGAHVVVAGRNSRQHVSSLNRFTVLGHVNNMADFYNSCDLMIGAGRVATEACCCGVPTIAIGAKGWQGLVTTEKLNRMMYTNFGDHGPVRTWSDHNLLQTIEKVQKRQTQSRQIANHVRNKVIRVASLDKMAKRVAAIYHS